MAETLYRPNLFYALWPDEETRVRLASLQTYVHGRLTRPANLHLTLAFLGSQPDAMLPVLRSIVTRLDFKPMTLDIDQLDHFKKNRIAWAGLRDMPPKLAQLRNSLVKELSRKGINADTMRTFKPHVTLARNASPPENRSFAAIRWRANHLVLARSPLPGEKSLYQMLASREVDAINERPAFSSTAKNKEK